MKNKMITFLTSRALIATLGLIGTALALAYPSHFSAFCGS